MKRTITLMLYTSSNAEVEELKDFCKREGIEFTAKNFRGKEIYDFEIIGETYDYHKLASKYGTRLKETHYAGLGNALDLDASTFHQWKEVMDRFYTRYTADSRLHHDFCTLLRDITDVTKLRYLTKYTLDDFAKEVLSDRIAVLSGELSSFEEHLHNIVEIDKMVSLLKQTKEGNHTLTDNDIAALIDILEVQLGK